MAAITAMTAAGACGGGDPPAPKLADLGPAPAIELAAVSGDRPVSLAAARGRWVLVNFWASSCIPCRKETPALEAAHRRHGGAVTFLGVDVEDQRADAQRAVRAWGATYPSAYDRAGVLADAYQLRGLPTTVLVDPAGRLRLRHVGPLSSTQIDQLIRATAA